MLDFKREQKVKGQRGAKKTKTNQKCRSSDTHQSKSEDWYPVIGKFDPRVFWDVGWRAQNDQAQDGEDAADGLDVDGGEAVVANVAPAVINNIQILKHLDMGVRRGEQEGTLAHPPHRTHTQPS